MNAGQENNTKYVLRKQSRVLDESWSHSVAGVEVHV